MGVGCGAKFQPACLCSRNHGNYWQEPEEASHPPPPCEKKGLLQFLWTSCWDQVDLWPWSFLHTIRGHSGIFHICQRCGLWADPDSSGFYKENKKKDNQNQTIISEMTAISVLLKLLFLWTIVKVESPKSRKTCLNPYSGPHKLWNIVKIHKISLSSGY